MIRLLRMTALENSESYPSLRIDLPRNDTVILRLRDVATYDSRSG